MTIRVDALQEDGVHVDETGHQDAASLRGGELLPGRARAARCRADPGIVQDSLDRSYVGLAAFIALSWDFVVWRGWLVST